MGNIREVRDSFVRGWIGWLRRVSAGGGQIQRESRDILFPIANICTLARLVVGRPGGINK